MKIATDGTVVDGVSAVDVSMVTGEPVPVEVGIGDEVIGATINTSGSLTVEATRVGADTALAQIIRLVDEAQGSRAEIQRLADRVSAVFVPLAIITAVVTLVSWLGVGQPAGEAFTAAVAVLIIACPCALGLATPMSITVASARGARAGVLFRDAATIEALGRTDTLVIDKTGTLTFGGMRANVVVLPIGEDLEVLATMAASSNHPVSAAILAALPRQTFRADLTVREVTLSDLLREVDQLITAALADPQINAGVRSALAVCEELGL